MKILDVYIGRTILHQTAVVLGVLLGLFAFVGFVDEVGELGTNNYTLFKIVKFIILSMPRLIYELFPMAALLGTMLGLSMLAQDSELVVLRASGISLYRIVGAALKMGLVFVALAVAMGELVVPTTETRAQRGRAEALQKDIQQQTDFGLWMRDGHTIVNVGEVLPDLTLLRLRIFEFDDSGQLRSLVYAREGRYEETGWQLWDVGQTFIDQQTVTTRQVDTAAWTTGVSPGILSVFLVSPEQLSAWQLKQYIDHLRENSQETDSFELAFWSKVGLPLATAVMVVLAVPFVFRQVRSGALGRGLLVGIMLGLGFYVANKGFGYVVLVYGIAPVVGATAPLAGFLMAALVMLRRVS